MKRRLGIIPEAFARPLFTTFRTPEFTLTPGTPGELAIKLREDSLDGAFLSPIDAARCGAGYLVGSGDALVARAGSRTAHLVFREGLQSIGTIAADPGRTAEIVLAHIVLLEKYDLTPRILPLRGEPSGPPSGTDALLLAGGDARSSPGEVHRIDLIEEWEDIAGLPFVHGLWIVREETFGPGDAGLFSHVPPSGGEESGDSLSFTLDEEARAGLSEFLKMAFYHGILKDIPEFRGLSGDRLL